MDAEQLELWRNAVIEHRVRVESVADDHAELKRVFELHLKRFFDYDAIDFKLDFSEITLAWKYEHDPIIDFDSISDLGMPCIISSEYNESLGQSVIIKVYPFGIEED